MAGQLIPYGQNTPHNWLKMSQFNSIKCFQIASFAIFFYFTPALRGKAMLYRCASQSIAPDLFFIANYFQICGELCISKNIMAVHLQNNCAGSVEFCLVQ